MTPWPFWLGGAGLAFVMVLHWLVQRRMMAVSGRYTAIVNRLRLGGPAPEPAPAAEDDLVAALRAATAAEFGASAVEDVPADRAPQTAPRAPRADQPAATHLIFLLSIGVGGLASSLLGGTFRPTLGLHGEVFAKIVHGSPVVGGAFLLFGGVLVGFGTRMAGGCTSGHGLCGISRFQKGSLFATLAFFATGVATSLLLGRLP